MLIGLNGQRILIENPAGPEKYTISIYNGLAKIDKNNHYLLYLNQEPEKDFFEKLTGGNPYFSPRILSSKISWTQKALSNQLFLDNLDVFFTPVHTLPLVRPAKTKYVGMIHGLEYAHMIPKNIFQKMLLGKPEKFVCKYADALVVPSIATKDAILKKGWNDGENIFVVEEGVNDTFYRRGEEEINVVREKYKIFKSRYILFVGTINPRKNLPRTIEAFSQVLKETGQKDWKFAISGKLGWDYNDTLNASKKYGVEENVIYMGRVCDEDIPALMSGAEALVNFSLEEGFGLPLLESMACETQCVLSDIPSYRGISGDTAYYAEPKNVNSIKKAIIYAFNCKDQQKIIQAKEMSKGHSWDRSAEKTLRVFESLVKDF